MRFTTMAAPVLAVAALLVSACTPMASGGTEMASAEPVAEAPMTQTPDAAACAARGGEIRRVGRMQSEQCVLLFADAGKTCTSGDQCQGDCRASDEKRPAPGSSATGVCSPDSTRFGCHTTIEDGKVANTLCVD